MVVGKIRYWIPFMLTFVLNLIISGVLRVVDIEFGKMRIKTVNRAIVVTILSLMLILQIVASPSIMFIQNAEAVIPVSEITRADSEGTNIVEAISLTIQPGDTGRTVTFEFRGFDDNDRVQELQCSWNGGEYLQSNCSTVSPETQATFAGPDGVPRLYNVKTGTASRELPPSPNAYTFGVRVLNDNFGLSAPATRTFKMVQDSPPPTANIDRTIKVRFDSLTVKDDQDHFGFTSAKCCSGEWYLAAYVQGKPVPLLINRGDVDDGDTYRFGTEREVVFNILKDQPQALSIMTLGAEDDTGFFQDCFKYYLPTGCGFCGSGAEDGANIRNILNSEAIGNWHEAIHAYQNADKTCRDDEKLGFINEVYLADTFGAGEHPVVSSNGGYTLRYTISVGPYAAPPVSEDHKVKVNFDSITVHNNREGSDGGEYHLFAFVHGMGVDLVPPTEFGVCGGNPTHCGGLWDVKNGQTLTFKPDTSITVDLPSNTPLTIFTIGEEVDSCDADFHNFLPDIRVIAEKYPEYSQYLSAFKNPPDWNAAQEKIYHFQRSLSTYAECPFANDDEILGTINELYYGPNYEAGTKEITSTIGDFTLRYTVSVVPP